MKRTWWILLAVVLWIISFGLTIYYFLSGDFPAILGIMPILLIIVHVAAKKS